MIRMKGRIHSVESMGLLDGPGVRFVVFMQGCTLRCVYCHNPDTWDIYSGEEIEAADLLKKIESFRPYFEASGGGVTFSGGEPLLQAEFLLEMLALCRKAGIRTALDTAGIGMGEYKEILRLTDLVILDIKHYETAGYKRITGFEMQALEPFIQALAECSADVWIRHVVVPGLTDNKEHIRRLKKFIEKIPNVSRTELIAYHNLGENKYAQLGLRYRLAGIKPLSEEELKFLEE